MSEPFGPRAVEHLKRSAKRNTEMTTELFLGGLTILTLAAVIILALTTGRRELHPDEDRAGRDKQQPETQRSNYRSDY